MTNSIKILTITFLMLMIFSTSYAQEDNPIAVGIICPEIIVVDNFYDIANNYEYKNYSYKELKLFTELGIYTNKYIKLEQANDEHSIYLKTSLVDEKDNETYPFNSSTIWTKFKSYNLLCYEIEDDFVKVKVSGSFYWLDKSQIANFGFTAQNWKAYFKRTNSENLIVNVNLNLREQANAGSKKILTIHENIRHSLKITGNFKGQWAEVNVTIYNSNWGVYSQHIDKQVTGWVKFLAESGKPNIQSSPGWGC